MAYECKVKDWVKMKIWYELECIYEWMKSMNGTCLWVKCLWMEFEKPFMDESLSIEPKKNFYGKCMNIKSINGRLSRMGSMY